MPTFISHSSCLTNKVDLKWWILTVLHSKASVFLPLRLSVLYSLFPNLSVSPIILQVYALWLHHLSGIFRSPSQYVCDTMRPCTCTRHSTQGPRSVSYSVHDILLYVAQHYIPEQKNIAQHQTSNRYRRNDVDFSIAFSVICLVAESGFRVQSSI